MQLQETRQPFQLLLLLFGLIIGIGCHSSKNEGYVRMKFDFGNLPPHPDAYCDSDKDSVLRADLRSSLSSEGGANHASVIQKIKSLRQTHGRCIPTEWALAYVLGADFQWLEAMDVIDMAIQEYGADQGLVALRVEIALQLAEYGPNMDIPADSMIEIPNGGKFRYATEQFRLANLVVAADGLEFITRSDSLNGQGMHQLGMIYRKMKDYPRSDQTFKRLQAMEGWRDEAQVALIDNLVLQGDLETANSSLEAVRGRYPRNFRLIQKQIEICKKRGDTAPIPQLEQMANFYRWLPQYLELPYSEENYATINYFREDHSESEKSIALKKVSERPDNEAADLYIGILVMHANHHNHIEGEAERALVDLGAPAAGKLASLLHRAPSTCAINHAASALSGIKDEKGWQPLVDMLPKINDMGFATKMPSIPQYLVQFDRVRALPVLLAWIKSRMENPSPAAPPGSLDEIYADNIIFDPLQVYEDATLIREAKTLEFSEEQVQLLLKKVQESRED